ncbi:MAG: DUF3854 domain-containing protein [Polyangiales bacterium]
MSASKDHYGSIGGRTGWLDASRSRRCPVCDGDSWCQIGSGTHAGIILCKRVASTREKTNRDGVTYWVHCDARTTDHATTSALDESHEEVSRAPSVVLDEAYRAVLATLRLDDRHRDNLRARGLTDEAIKRGGYRSLHIDGRARAARVIERAVGEREMKCVPGVVREHRDGRSWWSLRGAVGLVIPSLDLEGRVVALKVRADEATEGSRYTAVSSRKHGGASAVVNVHVPIGARERWQRTSVLWITEGELKADVCTALDQFAIVGVPGVSLWKSAIPLVEAINPRRVVVAFDADWKSLDPKKRHVREAREQLVTALASLGFDTHAADWPLSEGKGLDDYLLRVRRAARRAA